MRCRSSRDRHDRTGAFWCSSSVRSVPTTSSGSDGSRRARCAMISRLSSSHQCRSSSASSAGPSSVREASRSAASRTSSRRRRCASPASAGASATSARSATRARPRAATSARSERDIAWPRSSSRPADSSTSCGKAPAAHSSEALGRGQPLHRLQQPGLADAGLAGQQQQMTAAGAHGGDPTRREREQVVPAVHRGGADVPRHCRPAHPTSVPGSPPACRAFDR